MGNQIISEAVYLDNIKNLSSEYIEDFLSKTYGEIVRWAVIEVNDSKLKIDVTYETQEVRK